MAHNLKRIVAVGRERVFTFLSSKHFIFNGAINVLTSEGELTLWKSLKHNSPFLKEEFDSTLYKYNTNTAYVFDYYNKSYLKELVVEACGALIKFDENNEQVIYMKSRSMSVETISKLEYDVWTLIQNRSSLYNIYMFIATNYTEKIANDFVFYSIPNLQSAQLLDVFIEPSIVLQN